MSNDAILSPVFPVSPDQQQDGSTIAKLSIGKTFATITDVEKVIQSLQNEHHPLKVLKCDTVESYNKKV